MLVTRNTKTHTHAMCERFDSSDVPAAVTQAHDTREKRRITPFFFFCLFVRPLIAS